MKGKDPNIVKKRDCKNIRKIIMKGKAKEKRYEMINVYNQRSEKYRKRKNKWAAKENKSEG